MRSLAEALLSLSRSLNATNNREELLRVLAPAVRELVDVETVALSVEPAPDSELTTAPFVWRIVLDAGEWRFGALVLAGNTHAR